MAITKKTSFILIFAIAIFSTACSLLPDGGTAVRDYRGETFNALCEEVSNSESPGKLFEFSILSLNFDDDTCISEGNYEISGAVQIKSKGGYAEITKFLSVTSKATVHLSNPSIAENEIEIGFVCRGKKEKKFPILQDSIMELVGVETESKNDSEFVYSYSLTVNDENYATVEFSCAEELSEEALDELCKMVKNNIVVMNDR